ncbi:MAG: putative metallo-hydrolase YycJ [Phycisphaerae bacterium]|nr:putative metallo-hydrolase YycJ [Phycisphaerae bacterium]
MSQLFLHHGENDFVTCSIQSGSNGNCIYVEAGETKLLFDAGVSARLVRERLKVHNRQLLQANGIFVSHEHSDHIRSAGVFHRIFKAPLYMTHGTSRNNCCALGAVQDLRLFSAGSSLEVGEIVVHTLPTPHDGTEGVGFVVEYKKRRLGILTDLGYSFAELRQLMTTLDAVYLESNYDEEMLEEGPYPEDLKRRIRGTTGHLSNEEAARLVQETRQRSNRLQWVAIAHLSEQNNDPRIALATHQRINGRHFPYRLASREEVSPMMEIGLHNDYIGSSEIIALEAPTRQQEDDQLK